MNTETFGELVQRYRQNWRIDIPTFCQLVGISPSKYSRLVRGEASVSIRVAKQILSVLGISQPELSAVLATEEDDMHALGVRIFSRLTQQLGRPVDQTWLRQSLTTLANCAKHEPTPGLHQLQLLLQLYQQDLLTSRRAAVRERLLTTLMRYRSWTSFECELFLCLTPFLSFAEMATGIAQFLNTERRAASETERIQATTDTRLDPYFIDLSTQFICAALQTRQPENVAVALDWVLTLKVQVNGLERRVIKRLAAIIKDHLTDSATGQEAVTEFWTNLKAWGLTSTDAIYKDANRVLMTWQAQPLCETTPSAVNPVILTQLHEGGTPMPLPTTISEFRQAKRITTATVAKAVGVSYATYHRLESDDDAVGFDILLRTMNYLSVSFEELQFFNNIELLAERRDFAVQVDQVMAGNVPANSLLTRADALREQADFAKLPALQLLSDIVELTYYDLQQDENAYVTGAKRVIERCLQLRGWGDFVIDTALGCLEVLPYECAKLILTSYLDDSQLGRRYMVLITTLLSSAVRDRPAVVIPDLAALLKQYFAQSRDMDLLAMRQFVAAVSLAVRGHLAAGHAQVEALLARYTYIWPSEQNVTRRAFVMMQHQVAEAINGTPVEV